MDSATISEIFRNLVPIVLMIGLFLFARLALKSKNLRSVEAGIAISLIMWAVSETLHVMSLLGALEGETTEDMVEVIHTAAMVAFGVFIVLRLK